MRIHVDDPDHVESLLSFLNERVHVIAVRSGPNELEVSQLGSMNEDARRLELDLLLQLWQARHESAHARIAD
jgi:hypothetical protein